MFGHNSVLKFDIFNLVVVKFGGSLVIVKYRNCCLVLEILLRHFAVKMHHITLKYSSSIITRPTFF